MRSKNFQFMKKIDLQLYGALCEIEYNARINPFDAAHKCRILYEMILNSILEKHGMKLIGDPAEKKKLIRENRFYLPWERNLPKIRARCYMHNESICIEEMDAYNFLKKLGNASSHDEPYPWNDAWNNPIPDTVNVMHALSTFHKLLSLLYKNEIQDKVVGFKESDVPIGDFFIETEKDNIADSDRTHCIKEYSAYKYASDNVNRKIYGLIREYLIDDMSNLDKLTFDRMLDVYGVLGNQMRRKGVTLKKLNEPGTNYTNFFVVYEYDEDMIPLRALLKKEKLSNKTKITLCLKIAEQLKTFHSAEDHVYLRLLTYDSIMVKRLGSEDQGKEYDPIIIKFEFAKIVYDDSEETGVTILSLLQSISSQETVDSNKRISRYCINTDFDEGTDWEKVDVGSLGVLFIDICKGMITDKDPDNLIDEFIENNSLPDEMIDLMTEMIDPVNLCRPILGEVIDKLTHIIDTL